MGYQLNFCFGDVLLVVGFSLILCLVMSFGCGRSNGSEMSKREGGQMKRRTFGASVVGGALALPSLAGLKGESLH